MAVVVATGFVGGCRPPEALCKYTEYLEVTGSLTLETRRDVEAVADGCVFVNGDLRFRDRSAVDLSGLEGIIGVRGNVNITQAFALESTRGLDSLQFIHGNLVVQSCPALAEIDLPSLAGVKGDVRLEDLVAVDSLAGLASLKEVGGGLQVARLSSLREWDLPAVKYVGGALSIQENGLERIDGSDELFEIGGRLNIDGNSSLQVISGFDGLDRIGGGVSIRGAVPSYGEDCEPQPGAPGTAGWFSVYETPQLATVAGFSQIHTLAEGATCILSMGSLSLSKNTSLTRFEALPGLVRAREVSLRENWALDRLTPWDGLEIDELEVTQQPRLEELRVLEGLSAGAAYIHTNPDLVGLDGLVLATDADDVYVTANPKLTRIGDVAWQRVENLRVWGNPQLDDADALSTLEAAVRLLIVGNESLWQDDAVAATEHLDAPEVMKIAGNRGWIVPDECPWEGDDVCDEEIAWGFPVCASGTDEEDCGGR